MKNVKSAALLFLLTVGIAIGCKQESSRDEEASSVQSMSAPESAPAEEAISSDAAKVSTDTTRKFIRTADLKFKVKNVVKTTYAIENIAVRHGGFVTFTNLESVTNSEITNKINTDSSVVIKHFTVENNMIIRIPNTMLDSTLKTIAPLIDHMDFRIIKADDVSLRLLSNDMARKRASQTEKRLTDAIDTKGKKLNDITTAEEGLASKKEQSDNAKLNNMAIKDQINFSTINIAMYQREEIKREMIANDDTAAYSQSFGSRMVDAFHAGWTVITTIIVLLTNLWAVVLLSIILYFVYKKYRKTRKK